MTWSMLAAEALLPAAPASSLRRHVLGGNFSSLATQLSRSTPSLASRAAPPLIPELYTVVTFLSRPTFHLLRTKVQAAKRLFLGGLGGSA
jgi:hypothetical protein